MEESLTFTNQQAFLNTDAKNVIMISAISVLSSVSFPRRPYLSTIRNGLASMSTTENALK